LPERAPADRLREHGAGNPKFRDRYRNQGFWIDDRDQQSKSMFNSLLLLFSLTETGQSQAAPLVTIPTR